MTSSRPAGSPPYIDEDGKTDAEKYLEACLDSTIVACNKIKKLAARILPEMRDGYRIWHYDPEYAIRPVRFIERFCRFTEGKMAGKPFILEPYERMIVELAFGFVDEYGLRRFQEVIVEIGRKNGKGVHLFEELPTPNGWRKMGDLHVGDVVFGQDGKPSTIIAESEIFDKPTYVVTFEDGSHFKVTDDHIWTVRTKVSRKTMRRKPGPRGRIGNGKKYREGGWFETTTQEMFDDPLFVHHRADGKGVEYKYRVPMCLPVEYPEKDLPVDPYTLGYWLGDGSTGMSVVTVDWNDLEEAISHIEANGHTCSVCKKYANKAANVTIDKGTGEGLHSNAFICGLRDIGVLNNKHIPDMYLQASVEQRWELLRGLMDTDGYVSKAGQCEFTQKHEHIVDQIIELCSSLGIKATKRSKEARCNGKPAGTVYQAQFWTDKAHSCFHLRRKHERLKDRLADRMRCKSIVSIERIPNEPTKCIAIDNPSHLYLVGRSYTATHNTQLCAALNIYMLMKSGEHGAQCYNVATTSEQAALCYGTTEEMVFSNDILGSRIRKGRIAKRKVIGLNYDATNSYLCTLSGKAGTKDGLNPFFAVMDELGACRDHGDMYDQITEAIGAREEPMIFIITTENTVRHNIWDERKEYANKWLEGSVEDDRLLPILFELDDRSEVFIEECWAKANPGIGKVKSTQFIRDRLNKASQSPERMPSLLMKDFNLVANQYTSFLSYEDCYQRATYVPNPETDRYCVVGFDLAERNDLNACVAIFRRPGEDVLYERAMFWLAEEQLGLDDSNTKQRDDVPYLKWQSEGLIRVMQGSKINQRVVVDFIHELMDDGLYPMAIAYDKWHVDDWTRRDLANIVGEQNMHEVQPWSKDLSQAMKEQKIDLHAGVINDNDNDILHWCRSNVQARRDNADNVFALKKGLKPNKRIDGYMAEIYAYIAYKKHEESYLSMIGEDVERVMSNGSKVVELAQQ